MAHASKVYRVESVSLSFDRMLPTRMVVKAKGITSTPDWSEARLIPYIYVSPPADGIQECDFVASPPTEPVPAVLTPVVAAAQIEAVPEWVVGVRVYAAANRVVQRI